MTRDFRERYGPWALVAGASAGLGAAFAVELAARLSGEYGVQVRTAHLDLGAADLVERTRAATAGVEIGLLVYNEAYSLIGRFLAQPLEEKLRIVDVNCRGPLILADEMSSLAGARGSPLVATYAASKAFNLVLAESLWDELAEEGVDVLACRAGATKTPAYDASKPAGKVPIMDPAPVVGGGAGGVGPAAEHGAGGGESARGVLAWPAADAAGGDPGDGEDDAQALSGGGDLAASVRWVARCSRD